MDNFLLEPTIFGVRIIQSDYLVIGPFEDWSRVRSPGRARRRLRMGHRQNIALFYKPSPKMVWLPNGDLIGHPATIAELNRRVAVRSPSTAEEGR